MVLVGISFWILLIYVLIGVFIGWLGGLIYKGRGYGFLGNLVVGIVGTFLGRIVFWLFGFRIHTFFWSIFSAVIGAVLLLLLINSIIKN